MPTLLRHYRNVYLVGVGSHNMLTVRAAEPVVKPESVEQKHEPVSNDTDLYCIFVCACNACIVYKSAIGPFGIFQQNTRITLYVIVVVG